MSIFADFRSNRHVTHSPRRLPGSLNVPSPPPSIRRSPFSSANFHHLPHRDAALFPTLLSTSLHPSSLTKSSFPPLFPPTASFTATLPERTSQPKNITSPSRSRLLPPRFRIPSICSRSSSTLDSNSHAAHKAPRRRHNRHLGPRNPFRVVLKREQNHASFLWPEEMLCVMEHYYEAYAHRAGDYLSVDR